MYKNLYENAGKVAEEIRGGSFNPTSKQTMEKEAGLFARRTLQTLQQQDPDPVETIGRYIASIRDSAIRDPQEELLSPRETEGPSSVWDYSSISDFANALMMSESSGRSDVQITAESGGREQTMTGLFQFSEDRLEDYMNQTGASFTVEEFRQDEDLQKDVFAWHIADIDRLIDENNLLDLGYTRNGLRAVAHLGGNQGMLQWVRTGGEYNPSDADPERGRPQGTRLSDYYNRFEG